MWLEPHTTMQAVPHSLWAKGQGMLPTVHTCVYRYLLVYWKQLSTPLVSVKFMECKLHSFMWFNVIETYVGARTHALSAKHTTQPQASHAS